MDLDDKNISSLLAQSIIDANELKDLARQNAEKAIVDKYAPQIREAIEKLLEGEDDEEVPEMAPDGAGEEDGTEKGDEQIPVGAVGGEDKCPCPDDNEEVELDFNDLEKLSGEMSGGSSDEVGSHAELAGDVGAAAQTEESVSEAKEEPAKEDDEDTSDDPTEFYGQPKKKKKEEPKKHQYGPATEGIDLDEAIAKLLKLKEELVVDVKPMQSGWLGVPTSEVNYAQQLEMARQASTKVKEEKAEVEKALKALKIENKSLKDNLIKASKLLETLSVSNARLVYSSKALTATSLNERQKASIVEAVQKAETVEQAKLMFESLSTAVGGKPTGSRDSTLTEVLRGKSGSMLSISESLAAEGSESSPENDPAKLRMQELAGIRRNNK